MWQWLHVYKNKYKISLSVKAVVTCDFRDLSSTFIQNDLRLHDTPMQQELHFFSTLLLVNLKVYKIFPTLNIYHFKICLTFKASSIWTKFVLSTKHLFPTHATYVTWTQVQCQYKLVFKSPTWIFYETFPRFWPKIKCLDDIPMLECEDLN